jgi:hypothetical protein
MLTGTIWSALTRPSAKAVDYSQVPASGFESQRDSIHQPSVATQELRWDPASSMINPVRVASELDEE